MIKKLRRGNKKINLEYAARQMAYGNSRFEKVKERTIKA